MGRKGRGQKYAQSLGKRRKGSTEKERQRGVGRRGKGEEGGEKRR